MRAGILLLFLAAIAALLESPPAACSCTPPPPPIEALQRADAVFTGTVIGKYDARLGERSHSSSDPIEYTVVAHQIWKGDLPDTVTVQTEREGCSCGYPFRVGVNYLIYAWQRGNRWRTGLCTRTRPLSKAKVDLATFARLDVTGSTDPLESTQADAYVLLFERAQSSDPAVRAEAAAGLGALPRHRNQSVPLLLAIYKTGDERERMAAISSLAQLADDSTEVMETIARALGDESSMVRGTALQWVSNARERDVAPVVAPVLIELLDHPQEATRQRAIQLLRSFGPLAEAAIPSLTAILDDGDPVMRAAALGALRSVARDSLDMLRLVLRALDDRDSRVRQQAVAALARCSLAPDSILAALVVSLDDLADQVRVTAVRTLVHLRSSEPPLAARAKDALVMALEDEVKCVRMNSIRVLLRFAPQFPSLALDLIPLAHDPSYEVRAELVGALADLEPGVHTDTIQVVLCNALGDSSSQVRSCAARSLGEIGSCDASTVLVLDQLLQDPERRVRTSAARAIGRLAVGVEAAGLPLIRIIDSGNNELNEIACFGFRAAMSRSKMPCTETALVVLGRELWAGNTLVRRQAAEGLGKLRAAAPEAANLLAQALLDAEAPVRSAAVASLCRLAKNTPEAAPLLVMALDDESHHVRMRAAMCLGRLGSEAVEVVPALERLLNDEVEEVKRAAIHAIINIRGGY